MNHHDNNIESIAAELLTQALRQSTRQAQLKIIKDFLLTLGAKSSFSFNPKLTKREIKCLFLAAAGKTSKEIANLLEIKCCTVETHRKEILRKLSCRSITQAVHKGMKYGYLLLVKE